MAFYSALVGRSRWLPLAQRLWVVLIDKKVPGKFEEIEHCAEHDHILDSALLQRMPSLEKRKKITSCNLVCRASFPEHFPCNAIL